MNEKSMQYKSIAQKKIAFLTSLCLFLSAVEFAIPKPMPFLRLGIANLPVIIALHLLTVPQFFLLVVLKVFVQNLISGTLLSYTVLFSVAGSFASALSMLALYKAFYRRGWVSHVGISLFGSMFNSFAQIAVSYFFIFNENTKYIAPFLLVSSCITGIILGLIAEYFVKKSRWFSLVSGTDQNDGGAS